MPTQDSIYQVALQAQLSELVHRQQALVARLLQLPYYPIYVQGVDAALAREHLCKHIVQLEYDNDQMKGGETVSYQGLCGVDVEILHCVTCINEQRALLGKLLIDMDKLRTTDSSGGRVRLSQYALKQLGYARFNRRQAIRRFNVFESPLDSVSFFWARQRKITKASVQQVREDLIKKQASASANYAYYLKADLEHLANIPADEPLFYVYQKNDNPRANYKLRTQEGIKRGSCMASNPFFYLANENAALPRIRDLPSLEHRPPRLPRDDKTINDVAFLPSVHVHRSIS